MILGRLDPAGVVVKEFQIVVQEANQPDVFVDLGDAQLLAGEDGGEVDFALSDADSPTACGLHGLVMERIPRFRGWFVDSG